MSVSVLMSTYIKENPDWLDASLRSIYDDQTQKPDEIVLVLDGPLTPELQAVINRWKTALKDVLTIVANMRNQGLALSLNDGLKVAKGDIIVRMDSDDIAFPERIEKQVEFMELHKDIDVVGAWITEFIGTPDNVRSIRKVPETSDEIYEFGKCRNPLNHPSVAFRRERIVEHGGYTHFLLFEDYCLWAQLLTKGYRFYNIQESLLWFRTSADMFSRRGGWHYAFTELKFQRYLYGIGYITLPTLLRNSIVRFNGRIMPNWMRRFMYSHYVR
jgi:glycosyltransferase involved in cell wall biosynthesis